VRIALILPVAAAAALALLAADTSPDWGGDVQLRAMADELTRSKTLQLNKLEKPYFVQYASEDTEGFSVAAALGGVTQVAHFHRRTPLVEIRVGDYNFDNTNFLYTVQAPAGLLPTDDDYGVMRTVLWRASDVSYKLALTEIAQKRNAQREVAEPDKTPDLTPVKPVQVIEPIQKFAIDDKAWMSSVREASARFASHPDVMTSHIAMNAHGLTYRLVNSEGTIVRVPQSWAELEIRASAKGSEGRRVWNQYFVAGLDVSDFPHGTALSHLADTLASQTDQLQKAPLAEDYTGPVLFEKEAAAEMMAEVLTDAIVRHRKPVAPSNANGPAAQWQESVWATRVGSKVTPDWITIFDDPLARSFKGTKLAGYYTIDDEGVPAQRVSIVEAGAFRGFLMSREPVRDTDRSNGHGRLPGGFGEHLATIGNLFVQAGNTVSEAQLKARLIEKVKSAGLKYGLIIRRMDFPSTSTLEDLQGQARQAQKSGFTRTLSEPLLVYRVWPDGREELVRGLRFQEFSAKDLRDVAAAGNEPYVLNYINNGHSFNRTDGRAAIVPSSVICPSLLFESVELSRADNEGSLPPLVPAPALVAEQ
jgi:predicted Zn-dependent protease